MWKKTERLWRLPKMWLFNLMYNFMAGRHSLLVIDCEIRKLIPIKGEGNFPYYGYCKGWKDFAGMGISCVCVYDFFNNSYHVFLEDNLEELQILINRRKIVAGHNIKSFDVPLLAENNIFIPQFKVFDLFIEAKKALCLPINYVREDGPTNLKLSDLAKNNLAEKMQKGCGEDAPKMWQNDQIGDVINYCLQDVKDTKELLNIILRTGRLTDPNGGSIDFNFKKLRASIK